MLYRDFIPRELAPGWLQTPKNAAWLRASGDLKDSLAERCKDAVKVRFARLAPRDGLDQLGDERQIERGPSETNAAFAARVVDASWHLGCWAGTAQSVLLALRDVAASPSGRPWSFLRGRVKCDRQRRRKAREILVSGEDGNLASSSDGTEEKIGGRARHSSGAAEVVGLGGSLVVLGRHRLVLEVAQPAAARTLLLDSLETPGLNLTMSRPGT